MKLSAKPQGKIHMFLIFQPDTLYDVIEWTDRPKPQICLVSKKAWRELVCSLRKHPFLLALRRFLSDEERMQAS